jgi:catechol 2,3-dioxygenase-like lactoylglutathione lyase family enzyme
MLSGIAGIDHVVLAVRDLERAKSGWNRLGFTLSPRGRHIGQATANYCVMFAGEYLELMGAHPQPSPPAEGPKRGDLGARLDGFLERREGAMRVAFALRGTPEAAREALIALGFHPSAPRTLGREILLPSGSLVPQFRLIDLPAEETPGLESFLCFHLTPELIRRREWLEHANGVRGLKGIHVLVSETGSLIAAYDRLFGLSRVTTTDAVAAVEAGRHRITFMTPDDFLTIHPGIALDPDFPLPGIVALDLVTQRRERTAEYLAREGIAFAELSEGSLAVLEPEASGTILFFSES